MLPFKVCIHLLLEDALFLVNLRLFVEFTEYAIDAQITIIYTLIHAMLTLVEITLFEAILLLLLLLLLLLSDVGRLL